jgi:hypothetical protein
MGYHTILLLACLHVSLHHETKRSDAAETFPHAIIADAKKVCEKNGYSTNICFLIDLSKPSGKPRFFVYNFRDSAISRSGLVTHGSCNKLFLSTIIYSNKPGSGCSSFGRYRVGRFYKGIFGDSYRLYGLDSSNSNAFERNIVLHSHRCIPEKEIYPGQICNSQGCTTVSPVFLQELKKLILNEKKPILLWVLQ